ncbi:MAG: AraC family transcriptional regulator [Hyphomicrobiales bacterium]|nr:AraC family transcriptional regulator [Hyphomicrobiales bacterium]
MADLVRSASLTHFAATARSVGLDPMEMLRSAEIPPTALTDPDIRIPMGGFRRLLEASAIAAGVDDFGLRLAERGGLSNLGPVALLVREQPTVGSAMEALAHYVHIQSESLGVRVIRLGNEVAIAPSLLFGTPAPARQSIELVVGLAYRILAAFLGPGWRPLDVQFAHPAPRNRDIYRKFFACNVAFGAEYDAIIFPAGDLERPMPSADAALARYARDYVEAIAARSSHIEGKVRELVTALLPTGRCSAGRVARHLGCNQRTLQRRLAERGTTFFDIVEAQRAEIVVRLIEDDSRSLPAVAELLGFSAQSALSRWFRQRFDCSISQWRVRNRQIATPLLDGVELLGALTKSK